MLSNILRVGSAAAVLLWLAGCGSADAPPPPPKPIEETVFSDVTVKPLEKARDVQNTVDEQKRATDQALQEQEQ
jgi:hypothetical protein